MTSGTTTAAINRRRVSAAISSTAGRDNNSTGSNVQHGIDHSEVISAPPASAPITGSRKTAQNAAAASLRSRSAGQIMSPSAAGPGHAIASTMITGIAA